MIEKYPIHIRIRDLRRQYSLTQEELADALGISRQSVNAMETGRTLPSLPVAMYIATYFAVPLTQVFSFEAEQAVAVVKATAEPEESMGLMIPWSPFQEVLDTLMNDVIGSSLPAANILLEPEQVRLEMVLPGYGKDDIAIEVGEDFVSVSGEALEAEGDAYYQREFAIQPFSRTLGLPALVDKDKARADLRDGVLTLLMPLLREERPRTARIRIESGE